MIPFDRLPSSCEDLQEMVSAYCDDELTDEACTELKAHIAQCDTCSNEYRSDRLLKALVQRSCQCESAPDRLRVQILTRITSITFHER